MLVMNNYIMLLIMREWFCLNVLWKVKNSQEKRNCSLKIRVFKVLLCFKDKEYDENVLLFCKDKASDESTSLC